MLPEILIQNLRVVFVGTAVAETSNELGFYHLGAKNRFWEMLEFARISPTLVVSPSDRKALVDAKHTGVLNDVYKKFFFEKKESALLALRIGLTDLNRRRVVSNDADPAAEPTTNDTQIFVKKIEKYHPKIVAFVTGVEVFEKCFKGLYPSANRQRGKQDFLIGSSEVWLLGSTGVRAKDTDAMEQVFVDLADRLNDLVKEGD
ncbi:MAG TPA: uracil-DNA glycosylase family protein [Bacteroidota bacterium]|jgi:G:T/U-mismatch repair DNA glycosylase|nr:uracil-DNA glycosylase family protein [Bacteroidota bacterium]